MGNEVMPATKCGNCRHESICKHTEEMNNVQISVYNIKTSSKSPISVDVECSAYERKLQKQDGIVYR